MTTLTLKRQHAQLADHGQALPFERLACVIRVGSECIARVLELSRTRRLAGAEGAARGACAARDEGETAERAGILTAHRTLPRVSTSIDTAEFPRSRIAAENRTVSGLLCHGRCPAALVRTELLSGAFLEL